MLPLPLASPQAARAAVIGLALFVGGCASQQSGTQTAASAHSTVQSAGTMSRQIPAEGRDVPAQLAPSDAPPDDAKEPWSPHYGWRPRTQEFAPSYAPVPVERVTGTTRYATMDPDSVIRHAVAAHEMRRQ
ncbi:MAG: hypothetical protein ACKVP3_19420 [Hyphomicrobiaceae bacterium]